MHIPHLVTVDGPREGRTFIKVTQWEAGTQLSYWHRPPVWQQTSPSMEGRASRKEEERKGSQWPPEHRRTRRGGCQHSQDQPRVSWVYVLQSLASDFSGSMGMITNISQVWYHLCVGRWKGQTSLQQLHLGSLGSRATLLQSCHFSFLTTSTSPGGQTQLSLSRGRLGLRASALSPPLLPLHLLFDLKNLY